jgi:hypothetical protein
MELDCLAQISNRLVVLIIHGLFPVRYVELDPACLSNQERSKMGAITKKSKNYCSGALA